MPIGHGVVPPRKQTRIKLRLKGRYTLEGKVRPQLPHSNVLR